MNVKEQVELLDNEKMEHMEQQDTYVKIVMVKEFIMKQLEKLQV